MILFIYGEDSFRSKQKLDAIKSKYIDASLGDTNLAVLDFSEQSISYDKVVREILAMPFLAKKRLVIIKNILSHGKEKLQTQIIDFIKKIPEYVLVIFYENEKIDRRKALFKILFKQKKEEFKLLDDLELKSWIKKEVEIKGGQIEPQAIEKLILYVGNDLWRINNEIDKVVNYQAQITSENVELLIKPKISANVFNLIDAMGQKNRQRSIGELHKLLDSGENELYIFTMIIYQFRNLLIIKDVLERSKEKNSNLNLAKESGLHPFVMQKTVNQARNFSFKELKMIYQRLLDFDLKMKTGQVEPHLVLDIFVSELCN